MYTTYFKEIRNPAACFLITFKNQDGYKINVYSSLWEDMGKSFDNGTLCTFHE